MHNEPCDDAVTSLNCGQTATGVLHKGDHWTITNFTQNGQRSATTRLATNMPIKSHFEKTVRQVRSHLLSLPPSRETRETRQTVLVAHSVITKWHCHSRFLCTTGHDKQHAPTLRESIPTRCPRTFEQRTNEKVLNFDQRDFFLTNNVSHRFRSSSFMSSTMDLSTLAAWLDKHAEAHNITGETDRFIEPSSPRNCCFSPAVVADCGCARRPSPPRHWACLFPSHLPTTKWCVQRWAIQRS